MARHEHRLTWRRSGVLRSRIAQRRAPLERLALILQGHMAEATGEDPAALACSGQNVMHCGCPGERGAEGCLGRTNSEVWDERGANIPPLDEPPQFWQREVGPWEQA